jgi:acetyltransferase-like isoleucine patch superfamily enzyme
MPYEYAKTKIGDCCFIGTHAVVNKGVTIGNHCAVGAGSVVTGDVADLTIVAGVPAQPIGQVKTDSRGNVELIYEKRKAGR